MISVAVAGSWLVRRTRWSLDWIRHQSAHGVIDRGLHKHQQGSIMHRNSAQGAGQIIGQMGGLQVIGLDIAKSVVQLHSVDMATGEIVNLQLKRAKVLEHFANRAPCVIGIEACGGAHHWARELAGEGHPLRPRLEALTQSMDVAGYYELEL